jgi:hypothetical protein
VIDDHLHHPWPEDVKRALTPLEQGDVLDGLPTLGYFGRKSTATTKGAAQLEGDPASLELMEVVPTPDAWIVVSQSCDIAEEDKPRPMFPFLSVAPVYRDGPRGDVSAFEVDNIGMAYLMRLSGPDFADGSWVADLRYQQSIDKGLVVGATRRKGFKDSDDARDFAQRLADQVSRPAFEEPIVRCIVKPLRSLFRKKKSARDAMRQARLREFRLRVAGESRVATLMVVLGDGGDVDLARSTIEDWYNKTSVKCNAAGINFLGPRIGSLRILNADEYTQSSRLALDYLILRDDSPQPEPNAASTSA